MKALSRTCEANGSTCGITTELTQLLFQYYSLPSTNENTILFVDKVFRRVEGAIDEWMEHAKPTRGGGRLDGSTDESLQLMRVVVELIMKDVAKVFHDIQREKGAATLEYVVDACTLKLLSAVDEVPDSASKESSQHWLLLKRWMIITQIPHPSNFSRVYEPQHTHVLDLLHYGSAMRVAERVVAFVKGSKLPSVLAAEVVSKPEKPPSLKLSDSVYRFGAIFSAMIVVIPQMVATPALRTSIQSLVEPFTTQARKYRSAGHSRRGATLFSFLLSMGLHHNRFALLRCRNARLPWDWNDCWSNYARLLHHKMNDDNSEQVIQMVDVDVATVLMEQPERVVYFHGNWLLSSANYGAATTRTSSSRRVRE